MSPSLDITAVYSVSPNWYIGEPARRVSYGPLGACHGVSFAPPTDDGGVLVD